MDSGLPPGASGYVASEAMRGDTSHQVSTTPHPETPVARRSLFLGLVFLVLLCIGIAGLRLAWLATSTIESVVGWSLAAAALIPPAWIFRRGLRWIRTNRRLMSRRCIHCGTPIGKSVSLSCVSCGKDPSFE